MEVGFQRGVHLPKLDLWLDSRRRREFGLISHAHSDHTAKHQRPVMTRNTGLLLAEYLNGSSPMLYWTTASRWRPKSTPLHCIPPATAWARPRCW